MSADAPEPAPAKQARRCGNCGGHVSRRFVRVLGVNGEVNRCPRCADQGELARGAAADGLRGVDR